MSDSSVDGGEWTGREVCPDGACIGVIGPDGTCKVCGRASPLGARGIVDDQMDAPADDRLEPDPDSERDSDGDGDGGDGDVAAEGTGNEDAWARRRLCENGACIGVIGDDGRCTTCGAAVEPAP